MSLQSSLIPQGPGDGAHSLISIIAVNVVNTRSFNFQIQKIRRQEAEILLSHE